MNHQEREKILHIARSYIGTPYHNHGRIKGVGVDCLTLLANVYEEAGVVKNIHIPHYSADFMKHKGTERYLEGLLKYTTEVAKPLPGDIALWKFGRCFSHAAIVVRWPTIIHAHINRNVMLENVDNAKWLSMLGKEQRPIKFFSYWKHDELLKQTIGQRS